MIYQYIITKFSYFKLNDEEIQELSKILTFKKFKKKEIIFYSDERVNTIALIVKGSAYSTILDQDGKTRITSFHIPNCLGEFIINYEAYLQNNVSQKVYHAYEDSLLLLLDINAVKRLYDKFPRFYQLELMIMTPSFINALKYINILQANKAEQKIRLLKEYTPSIFQIFPYSYIASFLGIHRNTFNKAISHF